MEPPFSGMALVVARLRLNQRETRLLVRGGDDRTVVSPAPADGVRAGLVAAALTDAMTLVGDDGLVALWLRSPLPRRGGATPLEEAAWVGGELALRFVLRPHRTELVRLIAGLDDHHEGALLMAARAPARAEA